VEAGAMAYLVKPFTKRDILPAMQVAASRFAETRALED
jgi:response regulator NasT